MTAASSGRPSAVLSSGAFSMPEIPTAAAPRTSKASSKLLLADMRAKSLFPRLPPVVQSNSKADRRRDEEATGDASEDRIFSNQ